MSRSLWRRGAAVCLLAALLCLLTGCDPFADIRPYNFPDTLWVSEDGSACFAVTEAPTLLYTEVARGDAVKPLVLDFAPGTAGSLFDLASLQNADAAQPPALGDYRLWTGYFRFGRRKCTMESTREGTSALLFTDENGEEKLPMTFTRFDLTAEELAPLLPWEADGTLKPDFAPGGLLDLARKTAS